MPVKNIEVRSIDASLQASDVKTNGHTVEGYAVVFNQLASPTIPESFMETIAPDALRGVDLSNVQLYYNHDTSNILARADAGTLKLIPDDKGLRFQATLPDTTLGNDVYANIVNRNLQGCSFAFAVAADGDTWDQQADGTIVHTINKIDVLPEISITPDPVYSETSVAVQRSLEKIKGENNMNNDNQATEDNKKKPATAPEPAKEPDAEPAKATAKAPETPKEPVETRSITPTNDQIAALADKIGDVLEERSKNKTKEADNVAKTLVSPEDEKLQKRSKVRNEMHDYLQHKQVRAVTDGGIGLSDGSVLIPQDILPAEHEVHQFPRLGDMVRTIAVQHTTGKLPVFQISDDVLTPHTEYAETPANKVPEIKTILWNLQTYTGRYVFSQELIQDSDYDWESELSARLLELQQNTDDNLIMTALTNNIKPTAASDLVAAIKTALNVTLKPNDSSQASIVLSQSAWDALDQLKDGMGRPLIQPDPSQAAGHNLLGKSVIEVDDKLFPTAKAGDINAIISPLQKSVINFRQSQITGKFMDTYDVWYQQLGIFLREDVVQARPDLITYIHAAAAVAPAK
ncbi:phage major capsid protein [Schleiferilactobacillus harbinensis]|uniref:phage major capsid protein n=1 Tax=Schleiferilactobacillus harbinensis TaxID=304207 RepID=UPI0021A3C1C4|nr:phage major capsid protein [Schleiferilactobacillus harbinensis]MCT2909554.1 phage major capsid protein [Schleiferilactobacillus harbinensis]